MTACPQLSMQRIINDGSMVAMIFFVPYPADRMSVIPA
jgi:hypothetical protein